MVKYIHEKGVKSYVGSQHEGTIIPYDIMSHIANFSDNLKSLIQKDTIFEEILLSTFYSHFTGKKLMSICKVFWNKPGYAPSISDIEAETLPCVKRVDRKYNDPVRTWLRERANNYEARPRPSVLQTDPESHERSPS